jgi:hypothetical protein
LNYARRSLSAPREPCYHMQQEFNLSGDSCFREEFLNGSTASSTLPENRR